MTDPQRVGVNLLWLVPGVVGGSEEYTVRTLDGVLDVAPPDIDLVLFALRPFIEAHPELTERIETVTLSLTGRDKSVRVAAESSWLAYQCRRHGVAMVHHAGGILPAVRAVPGLLTVHDVQPLLHPENFSPGQAGLQPGRPAPVGQGGPAGGDPERVQPPGPAVGGRPAARTRLDRPARHPRPRRSGPGREVDLAQVEDAFGIKPPFFVYPAITYPHKNHLTLVRAFARVVKEHPEASLVLTGGEGQMEGEIHETIADLGLEGRVHRLGRIPWWDLAAILRQAHGLGFPSRFEGFGAPVIEAMARGCPVIAADATALPEVVGDAGVLVEPDDLDAWSTELLRSAGRPRAPRPARGRRLGTGRAVQRRGLGRGPARRVPRGAHALVNLTVIAPHFTPDVAPTGEVMTSIAEHLVARGHRLHVVTSLPWYRHHRIEHGWHGRLVRTETTDWGRISRVHPFPTDKTNIPARAVAFGGFTVLAGLVGADRSSTTRRRARHVAAADPGPGGLVGGPGPARPVRLQHPGRVPRRGHRGRRHRGATGHRRRPGPRAVHLPAVRRRHRPLRGPGRQPAGQAAAAGAGPHPGDPQLHRHRAGRPGGPAQRLPGRVRPR